MVTSIMALLMTSMVTSMMALLMTSILTTGYTISIGDPDG